MGLLHFECQHLDPQPSEKRIRLAYIHLIRLLAE